MSSVNFLEKLQDGVAVEWKALGDISTLRRGRVMSKEYLTDNFGKYPVYSSQTAQNGEIGSIHTFDFDGEFISWTTDGANAGTVFYRNEKFSITNVCGLIKINDKDELNCKYLFYWLTTEAKKHVYSGMGNPKLMSHQVEKIPVPIPCPENPEKSLAIQAEIVRILDAMTSHTAELTAELTLRQKQYKYYRDKLLSFEEGEVEWKTLGDENFFEVGSGGTPSKSKPEYWDDGNIPWLKSESCNNEPVYFANNFITELGLSKSSAKLLQKKTTLIALVGATIFKTAFLEFPAATNQNIASIKSKKPEAVSDKFVFYYITNLYEVLKSEMRNYGMLNLTTLRQFRIPIPHPEEQARIVAILDKFDALTNSITEGLPREIELRQKQYAYYRDALLSFPGPNAVGE